MTSELGKLKQPKVDNNALLDIISGLVGYRAVLVAHQLKIFELLKTHPLTLQQVAKALHIADRPAEAIIIANVALGLLRKIDSTYALAPIAQEYLLEDSPTYFGAWFDQLVLYVNRKLKEGRNFQLASNLRWRRYFRSHKEDIENAKASTRAMHSISMAPALVWPSSINLSEYSCLLDIGGAQVLTRSAPCGNGHNLPPLCLT